MPLSSAFDSKRTPELLPPPSQAKSKKNTSERSLEIVTPLKFLKGSALLTPCRRGRVTIHRRLNARDIQRELVSKPPPRIRRSSWSVGRIIAVRREDDDRYPYRCRAFGRAYSQLGLFQSSARCY